MMGRQSRQMAMVFVDAYEEYALYGGMPLVLSRKTDANYKCKLDTRMDKKCSAEAGLGYLGASTAGAVKDAAGKAEPVP